jgi:hypothetical protein
LAILLLIFKKNIAERGLTKPLFYVIMYTEREVRQMKDKNFDRRIFKKTGDELQEYLAFKRRGSRVENKKGKGSYNRRKFKRGED